MFIMSGYFFQSYFGPLLLLAVLRHNLQLTFWQGALFSSSVHNSYIHKGITVWDMSIVGINIDIL